MTKFQLSALLFADSNVQATIQGHTGQVSSIQREDGSGHCFNVIMWDNATDRLITLFVRTID
jgi:hypothetical protein